MAWVLGPVMNEGEGGGGGANGADGVIYISAERYGHLDRQQR